MLKIFKNYNGNTKEITNFCTSVSISGSLTEVSRKLEVTYMYPIWEHNQINEQVGIITKVWCILDGKEIFKGIVVDRSINSNEELQFTAFDYAYYLNRNEVTRNFKNITVQDATRDILNEIGVQAGNLASSNIKLRWLIAQKSAYTGIQELYTQISKQTNIKYYIYMDGIKVCVGEMGKRLTDIPIRPTSDQYHGDGNLLSFDYKDTMGEMVNRVKIYDDKNGYVGMVDNSYLIKNYGILQKNYVKEQDKNPNIVARNMIHGVDKKFNCTTIGDWNYRTGYAVNVNLFAISNLRNVVMYVIGDTHTWDMVTGTFTTDLELSYVRSMNEKESSDTKKFDEKQRKEAIKLEKKRIREEKKRLRELKGKK